MNLSSKKILSLISIFIGSLLLLWFIALFLDSIIFQAKVKRIEVVNASKNIEDYIKSQLKFVEGANLSNLDIYEIKRYIETIPWITRASVRREYPSVLKIELLEFNPFFIWQIDNKSYIVDGKNRILPKSYLSKMVNIITIKNGKEALLHSSKIRFLIYQDLRVLKLVKSLEYKDYRWDIVLKNGIIIKMPEQDEQNAWNLLLQYHRNKDILSRKIEYIDLRIKDTLVIKPL